MTKEVQKIKDELINRKKQILQDLQDLSKKDPHEVDNRTAAFPEYGDKPDENAQEISEYSTVIATEKVLEKALEEIEGTLKRIEDGTYGVCKYCGNEIGQFALIGAGAVVTKPVKPYALVVGNPSKQIGWVSEYGHRLNFDDKGFAICEESKQEYKLENEQVIRTK